MNEEIVRYGTKWDMIAQRLLYIDEAAMLNHMYLEEGKPISEIATALGCSQITARSRLIAHNIPTRSRGGPQIKSKVRYHIRLLDQRWFRMASVTEIAKVLGCTEHAVYRYRREL